MYSSALRFIAQSYIQVIRLLVDLRNSGVISRPRSLEQSFLIVYTHC